MITTPDTTTAGYTEFIQQLFDDSVTPFECLILTHNNPTLMSNLDAACTGKPTAMIDAPQDSWHLGEGDLLDAITWAIKAGGIKHLILAGDSSATPRSRRHSISPTSPLRSDPLALAEAANSNRKAAQDQFQQELNRLRKNPQISEAIASDGVQLTGLFYRSESGAFAIYDEERGAFQLLS